MLYFLKYFFFLCFFINLFQINVKSENIQNKLKWEEWKRNLIIDIQKTGKYSENTVKKLKNITFNEKVIKLDRNQPEFKLTFKDYLNKVTPEIVVSRGIKEKKNIIKDLALISDKYKVDSDILVALWGVESFYGKNLGNFIIINSLASLSFDGRRKKFFLNQLKHSLEIIEKNNFSIKDYKGSWAGAFGQTQFMPSTFLNYAVDYNGDGIKDLKKNSLDALASGANYLKKMGWKESLNWGEEITLNETDDSKIKKDKCISLQYLQEKDLKLKKKYPSNTCFRIIKPEKNEKSTFLVTSNFDILLKWNKSNYFALAVGKLSDKISAGQ